MTLATGDSDNMAHEAPEASVDDIDFAHPSERVAAEILDFYQVRWEYEPTTFPIEWDADGNVIASFSPDFYLPDFDLYIELTTMNQKLVTKKNRKVRRLKELYPDVNIKIFYQKDFRRLLHRFGLAAEDRPQKVGGGVVVKEPGHGEVAMTAPPLPDVCDAVLLVRGADPRRVAELGEALTRDYSGHDLRLVTVLRGGHHLSRRSRAGDRSARSISTSWPSRRTAPGKGGVVRVTKDLDEDIAGKSVVLVEDVIDTGLTVNYVLRLLRAHNPSKPRGLRASGQGRAAHRRRPHRASRLQDPRPFRGRLRSGLARPLSEPPVRSDAQGGGTARAMKRRLLGAGLILVAVVAPRHSRLRAHRALVRSSTRST